MELQLATAVPPPLPRGASMLAIPAALAMRRRRGNVRPPVGQFSLGLECSPGTRFGEPARAVAASMAHYDGVRTGVCNDYLNALARAEPEHLRGLKRRGCSIVFAETVPAGMHAAAGLRGRPWTAAQRDSYERGYGRAAGVAAVFADEFDALVFPTAYRALDLEHPVMHELGHALTYAWAIKHGSEHPALLLDLPAGIDELIGGAGYPQGMDEASVAIRVSEVLAEAYVYLLVERADELPLAVLLAATRILPS